MPFGYLIAIILIYVSAFISFYCIIPTICVVIGSSCLIQVFIERLVNDVNNLNELAKMADEKHNEMIELFHKIVQDFSDVKQLSVKIS